MKVTEIKIFKLTQMRGKKFQSLLSKSGWLVVLLVVWPCWILTSQVPDQARDYLSCQLHTVSVSQSVLSSQPLARQGAGSVRSHDCHNKILSLTSPPSPPLCCLQIITESQASMQNPGGQTLQDRLLAARHSLAGQGLAKAVCKATTEEIIGPKKKHLDCEY